MKLIRLISPENSKIADIKNVFSDEIVVTPYSKIALLNASIGLSDKSIVVDNSNNTFNFKTAVSADQRTVTITNGKYTQTSLVTGLAKQINASLQNSQYDNFVEWGVKIDNEKLQIEFSRSNSQTTTIDFDTRNMIKSGSTIKKENGTNGSWDGWAYTKQFVCRGATETKFGFNRSDRHFVAGLISESDLPGPADILEPSSYTYGIELTNATGSWTYHKVLNGVSTDTGVAPTTSNALRIKISGGEIVYEIQDNTNAVLYESKEPYNYPTKYRFAGSIQSNSDNIKSLIFCPSFYNNAQPLQMPVGLGATPTKVSISFPSEGVRNLLGFQNNAYNSVNNTTKALFEAEDSMRNTVTPPSVMIKLMNLSLQSYDGDTGRNSSIISTIPSFQQAGQFLVYNAPQLIPIDLNNEYSFILNQLHVQLLSMDQDQLDVDERVVLTFILLGKDERY